MKTYHKVETKVWDNGTASVQYKGVIISKVPLNDSCVEGSRYDLYMDYFETESEALAFVRSCKQQEAK